MIVKFILLIKTSAHLISKQFKNYRNINNFCFLIKKQYAFSSSISSIWVCIFQTVGIVLVFSLWKTLIF